MKRRIKNLRTKKYVCVYVFLGLVVGSVSGCYYSHYDRGDYRSPRSFHDDTDHRIDQD